MADHVRTLVFAVLSQSGDEPLTITQLEAEYKELEGEFIPAEKLGFANTRALLESMDMVEVWEAQGRVMVKAADCAATRHVVQLINAQKKHPAKQSPWIIPQNVEDNILAIIAVSPNERLPLSQLMNQYINFYQAKLPAPRGHKLAWLCTATKFVVTNDSGRIHILQPMRDVDMEPFRSLGKRRQLLSRQRHRQRQQHSLSSRVPPASGNMRARLQRQSQTERWIARTVRSPPRKDLMVKVQRSADKRIFERDLLTADTDSSVPTLVAQAKRPDGPHLSPLDAAFFGSSVGATATSQSDGSLPTRSAAIDASPLQRLTATNRSTGESCPTSAPGSGWLKPGKLVIDASQQGHTNSGPAGKPQTAVPSYNPVAEAVVMPWDVPLTPGQPDASGDSLAKPSSHIVVNTIRRQVVAAVKSNERLKGSKVHSPTGELLQVKSDVANEATCTTQRSETPPTIRPSVGAAATGQLHLLPPMCTVPKAETVAGGTSAGVLHGPSAAWASPTTKTVQDNPPLPQWIVDWAMRSTPATSSPMGQEPLPSSNCQVGPLSQPGVGSTVIRTVEQEAKTDLRRLLSTVSPSDQVGRLSLTSGSAVTSKPAEVSRPSSSLRLVGNDLAEQAVDNGCQHARCESDVEGEICSAFAQAAIDEPLVLAHSGEPTQEILGLPLEKLLNLVSFLRENPPVSQTFLPDLYWATYTEELTSRDRLDALVQSLMSHGIVEAGPGSSTIAISSKMPPETTYLLSTEPIDENRASSQEEIHGQVEGSDRLGFKLMPIREVLDVSALQPVSGLIVSDQAYLCVKNSHQDVVVAQECVSAPSPSGCFWQVRTEAGAHRIVHERTLFRLEGSGIAAPARPLIAWAAGKRPANGDIITVKVLKRTPSGVVVCHLAGEQLYSIYLLRYPSSTSVIPITVLRWGGQSYLLESDVATLDIKTEAEIPIRCLKHADALIDLLRREGISPEQKIVSVLDAIEMLAQRSVEDKLILDLLRL